MIVRSIGARALSVLGSASSIRVMGTSSHGVFLGVGSQVVFLSRERWRGPLTVNVEGRQEEWRALAQSQETALAAGGQVLMAGALQVSWWEAEVWSAPPRPTAPDASRMKENLQELLEGIPPLTLPSTLREEGTRPGRGGGGPVQAALRSGDVGCLLSALLPMLGLGSGLTPTGDDVVGGVLLALVRWGDRLAPGIDIGQLRIVIPSQAAIRTTALSAALLSCAAEGEADERLVLALDALVCGGPDLAQRARDLATYGHSSGGDALAGMALALNLNW